VQYVAITGAVRSRGRFAYREGMTLRDLLLMAGGPEERANLKEAEIARLPADRAGGRLAITERVPLDSSYVPARGLTAHTSEASVMARPAIGSEIPLQPYDNILILAQTDWERPRRVTIAGEVRSPGTY